MTAPLVPAGGTKTTDTSAPVASIASLTEPNTGTDGAVEVDALAGLLRVHAADDVRAGGDHPTGVLLPLGAGHALHDDLGCSRSGRSTCVSPLLRSQLGGAVSGAVHGVHQRHQRVVRVVQDPTPLLDVVAVEAYDERLVGLVAQDLQGVHDAVGDRVARR